MDNNINNTITNLNDNGFNTILCTDKNDLMNKILEFIPKHSQVANGSSTTLKEIGMIEYLSSTEDYEYLNKKVFSIQDPILRADERRKMCLADYFLTSVNAITEDGKIVAVDASGSRVGAFHFTAKHLIVVSGTNKIVENLDKAFSRIKEEVLPKEDERAMREYGAHTAIAKWVILEKEIIKDRINIFLLDEKLGF